MDPSQIGTMTDGRNLTLLGGAIAILVLGVKRVWVWGYQLTEEQAAHERTRRERDQWIEIARTGAYTVKNAVDLAAKK